MSRRLDTTKENIDISTVGSADLNVSIQRRCLVLMTHFESINAFGNALNERGLR